MTVNLGNENVPLAVRTAWAWEQIARVQPDFKVEYWSNPDPYAPYEIVVNDTYHFSGFSGARVMDIGACQGVFTVKCALNGAEVVAYEPHPGVLPLLRETLRRAGLEARVQVVEAAVTAETGQCVFHATEKTWGDRAPWTTYNGRVSKDEGPGPEVFGVTSRFGKAQAVSLDDAIGDQEWDCVKVDIEGGEFEALRTVSDDALRKVKFLTLEVHNDAANKAEHNALVERLEKVFDITGVKDGSPAYVPEDRWGSIYATRKETVL